MNRRFLASTVAVGLASLCVPRILIAADLPVPTPVLDGIPSIGATFNAVPAPLPSVSIVGTNGQFVGISLDTAIGMALTQNLDILLSESNHRISGYEVVGKRGPFGLNLTLQPQVSRAVTPAVSPFSAGPGGGPVTTVNAGLNAGLGIKLLNGTNLSVSAGETRTMSDSTANAYDPYYQTSIAFNVTHPLGSGQFSKDRRDLVLSVIAHVEQAQQTLITVSDTMANVIGTYWDLVAAWRNLGIQEQALSQAKAQSQSNQRLVRHGSAAPVDVVESNTQVDVDQDNVFSALQNVAMLQNRLKSLLLLTPGDPLWQVNLVPTSPLAVVPPEPQLDDLVVSGLVQRPELRLIAATMKRASVAAQYARDESRPQIDLQLQVSANGFAGEPGNLSQNPLFSGFNPLYSTVNQLIAASNANLPAGATPLAPVSPVAFTNSVATTGRFGTSWSSLFHNAYPLYSAQVNMALPLRNDRANGDRAIAREQARQAQLFEAQAVTRVIMDARNAIQVFDSARQRLISAHAARVAADRVLLGEERRFAVGRSTTFLVLQRQIIAANTQGREVQAQTDLNKAIAALDQVSGDIYTKHGIHIERASRTMVLDRLHSAGVPIDEGVLRPEPSPTPMPTPSSPPLTSPRVEPSAVGTSPPTATSSPNPSSTFPVPSKGVSPRSEQLLDNAKTIPNAGGEPIAQLRSGN